MVLANQVTTIKEMEELVYGGVQGRYIEPNDAANLLPIAKTTGTVVTTLGTGWHQAIYDAEAWIQLNMEANIFTMLAHGPWVRSGMRLIYGRSGTLPSDGVAQDGSLPSGTYPDVYVGSVTPKTTAVVWEISEVHQELATERYDDTFMSMEEARKYFIVEHKEDINVALCTNFDTLASNKMESVDRVTCSSVERAACGETANDEDLHGVDRSTYTWFNGTVSHNSNTDRYLTETILQTEWRTLGAAGARTGVIPTGWDTWGSWNELYDPKVRHELLAEKFVRPGVNGVETAQPGIQAGTPLSTWMATPVILSKDIVQDTLSRIYMLDSSNPQGHAFPRLSISVLKPTQYFEAGAGVNRPLEIAKMNLRGMYRTVAELRCPFPKVQGKIRDLK